MTEIRFVSNEELREAAALSDSVFRDAEQTSMGVAFPHIFAAGSSHSVGAFEAGKMVAFMGLVPKIIQVGRSQLQVHALGSVCTAPEFRGKGHASLMLDYVYTFIKQTGTSLLLVSGDRSLYTRSGCTTFGALNHYIITAQDVMNYRQDDEVKRINYRLFAAKDIFALHQLLKNSSVRYEGSIHDTAQLIDSEAVASNHRLNHKVYVAELDGKVIASVIVAASGRLTSDSEPFVVEWNGVATVAVSLISYVMKELSIAQLHLCSPWHEDDLHKALEGTSFTRNQNSGTIKIIDAANFLEQLKPHLIEKNADAASVINLVASEDALAFDLSVLGNIIQISYDELVALIFDPGADISSLKPYKSILDTLFPIAFPYTAGLHYV